MNEFEPTGLFRPLTRAQLDALLAFAQHGYDKSHIALATAPLVPEIVSEAAGVAQDCLVVWQEALNESIWRLWHGEPVTA